MENKQTITSVSLDFSKAFNTIDHEILYIELKYNDINNTIQNLEDNFIVKDDVNNETNVTDVVPNQAADDVQIVESDDEIIKVKPKKVKVVNDRFQWFIDFTAFNW